MISFWWGIALLLLLAAVWLLLASRIRQYRSTQRSEMNRRWYDEQKQKLQAERAQLGEQVYETELLALQKTYLHDQQSDEDIDWQPRSVIIPALGLVLIAALAYLAGNSWHQQQQADASLSILREKGAQVLTGKVNDGESVKAVAEGLRYKLSLTDDDAQGWWIYAGLMDALNRPNDALQAFEKSIALAPDNDNLKISFSRFLLTKGGPEQQARAAAMLAELLQQNPNNVEALSLLGYVAYQRGDWQQAITAWQRMLQQQGVDPQRVESVKTAIADAKQRQQQADRQLQVTVSLAADLANAIPEHATLFVFIKQPDGPPMPAAVVRQPVTEFPITVTLSDDNAMLADYAMSQLAQWQVEAVISQDAKITRQPGDLFAAPIITKASAKGTVDLQISERVK